MGFPSLIDLYRTTFVRVIQDRFRCMLDDLNLATTVQDIESFDLALQDHLADVWTALHLDQEAVSESLAQELLGSFALFLDLQDTGKQTFYSDGSDRSRRSDQIPGHRRAVRFDEHVARRIHDVELQHRVNLRRLGETYATVVGQTVDSLPAVPWSPSAMLDALSKVLDRIDVPVHQKVRLVLYEKFITDVLVHLGEASLTFRNALNERRSQTGEGGPSAAARNSGPRLSGGIVPTKDELKRAVDSRVEAAMPKKRVDADAGATAASKTKDSQEGQRQKPWFLRYAHLLASLILTILLAAAAWQLGTRFAEHRHGRVGQNETGRQAESPGEDGVLPKTTSPTSDIESPHPESPSSEEGVALPGQSPTVSDARSKHEVLREVELTDFGWTVEPLERMTLFDFSIKNGSQRRISRVEVVCLQYSTDLEMLGPLKAVLPDVIEPNTTRSFLQIPAGFADARVGRISCLIPDLSFE
jgi:hypothetical protein